MKKLLVLSLLMLAMSAVAFAGPLFSPYFEIENVGITATPTFEAGALLGADIADGWNLDLSGFYFDNDILIANDTFDLGFDASVGFEQTLLFTNGGNLDTGGSFALGSLSTFKSSAYPNNIQLITRSAGFMLEGFVGPVSVWGGVDFPWGGGVWLGLSPTIGIRVEFNIPLAKPDINL